MGLPIKRILWAPTNAAHYNHLHVEGDPEFKGTPPPNNPGMSDSLWTIWVALHERFGESGYFDLTKDWSHMGWYNRRHINNDPSQPWSQHAWSNALDIGPYYGVAQQKVFYDFLKGEQDMAFTPHEENELKKIIAGLDEVGSNGTAVKYMVLHLRNHPSSGSAVDQTARNIANAAQDAAASALNLAKQIRTKLQNLY